jgi:hypothetical protein
MKKILFVLLTVLLILSIFANGCQLTRYEKYLARIEDMNIWADESMPAQYFLYVMTFESGSCEVFYRYNMARHGNTIRVEVFNLRYLDRLCLAAVDHAYLIIRLGNDFVPGETYTVEVNDVTETFVAGEVSSDKGVG